MRQQPPGHSFEALEPNLEAQSLPLSTLSAALNIILFERNTQVPSFGTLEGHRNQT